MAVNQEIPTTPQESPWSKMNRTYSKYLPTGRDTFPIRFSLSSLVVSLFALQLLFFYIICCTSSTIYVHAFYVLLASVHYGVYYGLKTGKLRLVTPWLIWKVIETIFIVYIIVKGTIKWHRYSTSNIILAYFLLAINTLMMFCLYKHQVEACDVKDFEVEDESKKTPEV